jgi:protoporphyrinogen oxidase
MTPPSMPRDAAKEYDVVVVGGGIAGLTAAYELRGHRTILLEATDRVGGRVRSEQRGPYWVNLGAQFLAGDGPLWELATELGLESATLRGSHPALALRGKLVVSESPARMVLTLPLSPRSRLAMLRFGLKVRRTYKRLTGNPSSEDARRFREQLDRIDCSRYFSDIDNDDVRAILRALVRFWMGAEPEEVSAGHTAIYMGLSLANLQEVPPFSLVEGGNENIPRALAEALEGTIETAAVVEEVRPHDDGVRVRYRRQGEEHEIHAAECVVAVPADTALKTVVGIPPDRRRALEAVRYGTYVVVGFFTREQGRCPWDRVYAATVVDKSFQVVINPATVLHRDGDRPPGGALLTYAGGEPARRLIDRSDGEIVDVFQRDLEALFPALKGQVAEAVVQRWPAAIPYWEPGGRIYKDVLREPLDRIHLAADYVAYPSMQVAARAGITVAESIQQKLASVSVR